jgi:hypothetical protein
MTGVPREAFTGGLRTSTGFNATWPFARLTLSDDGLVIRLLGIVHARSKWGDVESAEGVVGGLMRSPGVRLRLAGRPPVVFWTFNKAAVLAALRSRGVAIIDPSGRPPKVWFGA